METNHETPKPHATQEKEPTFLRQTADPYIVQIVVTVPVMIFSVVVAIRAQYSLNPWMRTTLPFCKV